MKKSHEFEKNSFILFVLMMSTNVCNYLFQIIVGNLLLVEDYGIVNTVISIVAILTIPTTIITRVCARYIALFVATDNEKGIFAILRLLIRLILEIGAVLFVIIWFGRNVITAVFKIESTGYILGALILAIINLGYALSSGMLQGLKKFFPYGIQTIFIAGCKLILSIVFIMLGGRVYGVIGAIFIGSMIAIIYGGIYTWRYVKGALKSEGKQELDLKEFYKYTIGTVVIQGCIIAMTNGDILLVKVFFTDIEAGVYSSAMVIGKIAMYISTAIVATFFPMVVERHERGEETRGLLKKALFYGGGMTVVCALGMIILGKYAIDILFGDRYMEAISILPYVCVYIVPLTFLTILMNYVLAVGKSKILGITVVGGLITILGLSFVMHESIEQLISMCGLVMAVVVVINILSLIFIKSEEVDVNEG